jgi:hypothetical protein
MSTKTQTDSTNKYDPGSMSRYSGWQSSMFPILQSLFQNPTGSQFFNQNLQQNQRSASQLGGRNSSNALLNFQRSGIGGGSLGGGAMQQLMSGAGRYSSSLGYQAWNSTMNQAQADRWNAGSLGSQMFQPLQTGQSQTQTKSGLGTWLPQLIGAGLSGLAAVGTGGASLLATGAAGLGSQFGAGGASPEINSLLSNNLGGGYFSGPSIGGFSGGTSYTPSNPFQQGGGMY